MAARTWENRSADKDRRLDGGSTSARGTRLEQYSRAFHRACEILPAADQAIALERLSAADRMIELDRHPWQRRLVLIDNLARYQTLGVAEALLQRSRRAWTDDTHEAERNAELCLAVLGCLSTKRFHRALINDYRARAWAYVANARRIRAEFDRVEEAFRCAEEFLLSGTGDASELAHLLELRASFARATRRFGDAEQLLRRVVQIQAEVGDHHLEGRGLVGLALSRYSLGEPGEALELIERAAARIDARRDAHLNFAVAKNRALYLSDLGRTDEARACLPEVRRLAKALGTRLDHLRLLWVSALIHRDRGRHELAELALRRVRDGFIEENLPFDAALAALDLAALYLTSGRLAATAELARETATVFAALKVQPELLAALALFHQAAERQAATVAWVQQLAQEVRRRGLGLDPIDRDELGQP